MLNKKLFLASPLLFTIPVSTAQAIGTTTSMYQNQYAPTGVVDSCVNLGNHRYKISGWAYDQDYAGMSSFIEVYVDDMKISRFQTNLVREDVNASCHIEGKHGFEQIVELPFTGKHQLNIYAVDLNENNKQLINSREIVLEEINSKYTPNGCIDYLLSSRPGSIELGGWLYDLDVPHVSCKLKVMIDDQVVSYLDASQCREDVNKVYSITGNHGFSGVIPTNLSGEHLVSLYMIDPMTQVEYLLGQKKLNIQKASINQYLSIGCVDLVTSNLPGSFTVAGWAFDRDNVHQATYVNVYVDGQLADHFLADELREDVNKAYSITGNHGFTRQIKTNLSGNHQVVIKVVDINTLEEYEIGKQQITIQQASINRFDPIGHVDLCESNQPGELTVGGWGFDRDQLNSSSLIRVYVNGQNVKELYANQLRSDVNIAYNISGSHGFNGKVNVSISGQVEVRIVIVDRNTNVEKELLKKNLMIQKAIASIYKPETCLDYLVVENGQLHLRGWAYDRDDLSASLTINIYNNNQLLGSIKADQVRDDVNQIMKTTGRHGFDGYITPDFTGKALVVVKAVDPSTKQEVTIGQKEVEVQKAISTKFAPQGCVDFISYASQELKLGGWAFDQDDTSNAVVTQVYDNGTLIGTFLAGQVRDDVNKVYGITGRHGFNNTIKTDLKAGSHLIEVKVVDFITRNEVKIGAKTITVNSLATTSSRYLVRGNLDGITTNGSIDIIGWAADLDTTNTSVNIKVYVDGQLLGTGKTGILRDDVNKALGIQGKHGFHITLPTTLSGNHQIKVVAEDIQSKQEVSLKEGTYNIIPGKKMEVNAVIDSTFYYSGTTVRIIGWAFDRLEAGADTEILVYSNGDYVTKIKTNTFRVDVNKAYGISGNHGIDQVIKTNKTGSQTLEFYSLDHKKLGSKTIDIPAYTPPQLIEAQKYIGVVGGTTFNRWYGTPVSLGDAWCGTFVSYVANNVGILGTKIPRFCWVQTGVNEFKAKGKFVRPSLANPKPGDVIFFDYDKDNSADHVGYVERVVNNQVFTIEGNNGESKDPLKNSCKRATYFLNNTSIMGYGIVD